MNIFTDIHGTINRLTQQPPEVITDQTGNCGKFRISELDDDDKTELLTWKNEGGIYTKYIGEIEFWFEIVPDEE